MLEMGQMPPIMDHEKGVVLGGHWLPVSAGGGSFVLSSTIIIYALALFYNGICTAPHCGLLPSKKTPLQATAPLLPSQSRNREFGKSMNLGGAVDQRSRSRLR